MVAVTRDEPKHHIGDRIGPIMPPIGFEFALNGR